MFASIASGLIIAYVADKISKKETEEVKNK